MSSRTNAFDAVDAPLGGFVGVPVLDAGPVDGFDVGFAAEGDHDLRVADHLLGDRLGAPEPSTSEVRAWARDAGLHVTDRGRLRPEIWQAWRNAKQS